MKRSLALCALLPACAAPDVAVLALVCPLLAAAVVARYLVGLWRYDARLAVEWVDLGMPAAAENSASRIPRPLRARYLERARRAAAAIATLVVLALGGCRSPALRACEDVAVNLRSSAQPLVNCHPAARVEVTQVAGYPVAVCRCPVATDGGVAR